MHSRRHDFSSVYLIAGLTSRPLAEAAHRAGMAVAALDLFDDVDTRAFAHTTRKVASDGEGFDAEDLLRAADELCPPGACHGLVYAAGFEDRPELLAKLAEGRELFGNAPATVAALKHPQSLFALLDRLEIPHPPVTFDQPDDPDSWLVKKIGGSGGGHVRAASACDDLPAGCYYQRQILGSSVSALFLADGKRAHIVGFNQQWKAHGFVYGGAINRAMLAEPLRIEIAHKLDRLVAETGLAGLNGMDFIAGGQSYSVLEINPRPTATLDLYDAGCALFEWHLRACCGELPQSLPPTAVRAHAIVYAGYNMTIASEAWFAPWCRDTPHAGSRIGRGAPVCSVLAEGSDANGVMRDLRSRERLVDSALRKKAA